MKYIFFSSRTVWNETIELFILWHVWKCFGVLWVNSYQLAVHSRKHAWLNRYCYPIGCVIKRTHQGICSCSPIVNFFTFGPRGRRARSARRPRGQNVAAIALDMGQAHLWYENNTMQTIHAIQPLRTVCGFLDMGDGCCLIFNKNQLMFIVIKSITAQIKKKIILFFS